MTNDEIVLGLPDYQITGIEREQGVGQIRARYTGPRLCPHCGRRRQRSKGIVLRRVRHEDWGLRQCQLEVEIRKWRCLDCGRQFRQRLPGIQPHQRASESFQLAIFRQHLDGIKRSLLGQREAIGAAIVERYFRHGLKRHFSEQHSLRCPPVLGIDEHFFRRKKSFATTLCDLRQTQNL